MTPERRLHNLPLETILTWWAGMPAGRDYAHVVSMAWSTMGVRATAPEAKREIRECLRTVELLPADRPPTSDDYARAKVAWNDYLASQDIV